MRRLALTCTLFCLLRRVSAARPARSSLQQFEIAVSSGGPVVARPMHVIAGGCMLAHWPRSAAKQRSANPPAVVLQGDGPSDCSVADFSVHLATAASAVPAACSGALFQLRGGRWAEPQWLVHSSCSRSAAVTLRPQATSGVRRALRQAPGSRSGNTTCSGPNCKVFILLIITFGVMFGAIVTASVVTKCGPCLFCWWAWRHRHDDPPEITAHNARIASKGDPVVAAQLIGEVVTPCSSRHTDELGGEECPVCLQSEGEWSLLPCGHAICSPCLAQLVKSQAMVTKCPLCRDPLLPDAPEHQAAGSSASSSAGSSAGTISARSSTFSRASTLSTLSRSSGEAAGSSSTGDGGGGLSPRLGRALGLIRSSPQPVAGGPSDDAAAAAACSSTGDSSGGAPPVDAARTPAVIQLTSIPETPAAGAAAGRSSSMLGQP